MNATFDHFKSGIATWYLYDIVHTHSTVWVLPFCLQKVGKKPHREYMFNMNGQLERLQFHFRRPKFIATFAVIHFQGTQRAGVQNRINYTFTRSTTCVFSFYMVLVNAHVSAYIFAPL